MEVRLGYKHTGVGVIPEEWDSKPLGDLGETLIGLTYKPENVCENGTLVLRSSNIQDDALAFDDNVFVDTSVPERIKTRPGDVLICVRNGSRDLIGKSALLDERATGMTFGAFMAVYRSPIGKFASFLFQSEILKRQINEHLGATINQITNKSLNSFCIPVPPTDHEQRAIAEALGDVDALLDSLDCLIAKKRALKQAAMQQLLTAQTRLPGFHGKWEVKRLGDIGSTYGGLTGKTKADFGEGSARYITFMNIMSNVVIDCGAFEQVQVSSTELQNRAKKGDLFFNGSSETPEEVGMCSVLLDEVKDVYLNSFCFGFRFHESAETDGLFLAYYFRSKEGRELIKSLAQGSTRYNLSKIALSQSPLRLPKLPEQTAIAEVLSDMDAELAALEARRDKTRALKQGMMQELLTGKTRLI
jgi:type I restriction enzyme S subunit